MRDSYSDAIIWGFKLPLRTLHRKSFSLSFIFVICFYRGIRTWGQGGQPPSQFRGVGTRGSQGHVPSIFWASSTCGPQNIFSRPWVQLSVCPLNIWKLPTPLQFSTNFTCFPWYFTQKTFKVNHFQFSAPPIQFMCAPLSFREVVTPLFLNSISIEIYFLNLLAVFSYDFDGKLANFLKNWGGGAITLPASNAPPTLCCHVNTPKETRM